MFKLKNKKITETKIVQILFYTFPLSFIIGNLILSLHLLLFITISLFLINNKRLTIRFKNSYWLLIAFFLYFFLSTTIQYQSPGLLHEKIQSWPLENQPIFKSFLLVRFLILVFVVDTLFFNKILNLKKIFLCSLVCTSFISFDVILQNLIGFDLFGYKSVGMWNAGPFGDEKIAGGYLQKFSFFSFFYFFEISKNKKFNKPSLIFIIALHATAILFSGNKMPMILFLLGCALTILFVKNLRFVMSVGLLVFLTITFVTPNKNTYLHSIYKEAAPYIWAYKVKTSSTTPKILLDAKKAAEEKGVELEEMLKHIRDPGYIGVFRTSVKMWKEQPIFGFGLKSFRIKCWELLAKDKNLFMSCSNHSHNYYLELLSEAGIIGAALMIIFFFNLLKDSFYYLKKYNQKNDSNMNLLIPIIIIIFIEIWPIKTSGSFFTTWNATFFWLSAAILLTINKKELN